MNENKSPQTTETQRRNIKITAVARGVCYFLLQSHLPLS